jgi:M6 family metalloprotease-like protein
MSFHKIVLLILVVCMVLSAVLLSACGRKNSPVTTPSTPSVSEDAKLGFHTTKAKGEQKYIVVLTDFPDIQRQYSEQTIADRLIGFLEPYFKAASYDKLLLKGEITGPYVLPNPVSYYKISPKNLEVDPDKVTVLVTDAANAADSDINFNDYTYVIFALGATQVEYGMVGLCAVPGMLGFQITSITDKSGEVINNAAIFGENAHLGTYIHDSLHMIGGRIDNQRLTPCLYDHELQATYPHWPEFANALINMGYWDPLSSHVPYKYELPPTGLSSWTKLRLNWIDSAKIALVPAGQTATVKLDPLSDRNAATLVIKIPITNKTYYLVENRQKIGSDDNCPTTGVLVLYADDSIYECHNGKAPVKIMDANPSVPYMNDATFDIGKKDRYIDAKNNIAIILQKKDGLSYQIQITTADKGK